MDNPVYCFQLSQRKTVLIAARLRSGSEDGRLAGLDRGGVHGPYLYRMCCSVLLVFLRWDDVRRGEKVSVCIKMPQSDTNEEGSCEVTVTSESTRTRI